MTLQTPGRMVVVPAAFGAAVGVALWPLGPTAVLLGFAAFLAAQVVVLARSCRQLANAKRRLIASGARRELLRHQRRT
jgi:hypothetical protein